MSPDLAVALCVLAAIFVAVTGFFLVRRYVRRISRALGIGLDFPPPRINLAPASLEDLPHRAEAEELTRQLEALGFTEAEVHLLVELPQVYVLGLTHAEEPLLAALVDHPQAGVVLDLVAEGADGSVLTATNGPSTGPLVDPPFKRTLRQEGATPRALLDTLRQALASHPAEAVDTGPFASAFPRIWAREMDWRCARGGPSEDELQAFARQEGGELDVGQLSHARNQLLLSANAGLRTILHDAAEQAWPDALPDEDDVFGIVHDALTQDEMLGLVFAWLGAAPDADLPHEAGRSPRGHFAAIVDSLGDDARVRLLGQLEEPVSADVWVREPVEVSV